MKELHKLLEEPGNNGESIADGDGLAYNISEGDV